MARATSGPDTNGKIAGLLRDLAAVQKSTQSRWGYKRAAQAILALDEPIESFLQPDGTLRKIPNIGPSSTRVILEVLRTGASPIVQHAVDESGKTGEVQTRRNLRRNFLSHAQVAAALKDKALTGPSLEDYRGDLQMHSDWSDGPDARGDRRDGHRAWIRVLRRHRSLVRVADRAAACRWQSSPSSTRRSIG